MPRHPSFEQPADCDPNPGPAEFDDHPCLDNLKECPTCDALREDDGACPYCEGNE